MQVAKDGSLLVDEHITYAFSGPFSGGYRDIPLRDGESIDRVRVTENGRAVPRRGVHRARLHRRRRARTERRRVGNDLRVVWHYGAVDELRTFTVHYRMRGLAVAYDDVVDVNLKVWGSEWDSAARPAHGDRGRARQGAQGLGPPRLRPRRRRSSSARRCCCGRSTCPPASSSSSAR